ncbi:unnamed protein product [Heligmosomoides polygyrus]|uniref:Uncharacterized protein n=1 Tax=Heligmosomoides polygyrus TaxID=6339 RepID=A0A183GPU3_HELPZ|nr:unnamed protein product [Heligmosomoides polygyrus]
MLRYWANDTLSEYFAYKQGAGVTAGGPNTYLSTGSLKGSLNRQGIYKKYQSTAFDDPTKRAKLKQASIDCCPLTWEFEGFIQPGDCNQFFQKRFLMRVEKVKLTNGYPAKQCDIGQDVRDPSNQHFSVAERLEATDKMIREHQVTYLQYKLFKDNRKPDCNAVKNLEGDEEAKKAYRPALMYQSVLLEVGKDCEWVRICFDKDKTVCSDDVNTLSFIFVHGVYIPTDAGERLA